MEPMQSWLIDNEVGTGPFGEQTDRPNTVENQLLQMLPGDSRK